jgi:anti-sigma regulatory factor (Ser/Thr protein kinase)
MTVQPASITLAERDHVVQFYDHDSDLARSVGGYLAEAIEARCVAMVIATEAHRRAFEAELTAAGIDVAEGVRSGFLIWRDAATTLSTFMSRGAVDRDAFMREVGTLVRKGAERAPVRAYGEMVSLLWDGGDVLGAIELEKLWNELQGKLEFSLRCAYHSASVAGEEDAEALSQVCHLHSAVAHPHSGDLLAADPPETQVVGEFPPDAEAAPAARRFVTDALLAWDAGGALLEDAQLVVSELVSNAIIHAHSPFSVSAHLAPTAIRLSVQDGTRTPPTLAENDPTALSGRGLRVVAAIATDWGVDATGDGKTVWAELRR